MAALGATVVFSSHARAGNGQPTLIGWNNLGMHCMDDDYSVFTILPPFNTIDVQLIDAAGNLVTAADGISVSYEAVADPDGSFNSAAGGKTNFWDFVAVTYGADVPVEWGLAGTRMPGPANEPQPMAFDAGLNWFEGTGIPLTPVDDAGRTNPYPLFRLVARDAMGNLLAETHVVAPVSSEMDCRKCHSSGSGPAAEPAVGWVNDPSDKRDYRLNILLLHDQFNGTSLYQQVTQDNHPVLCAGCHLSEALPGTGVEGIPPLTAAMHARHAQVTDPGTGLVLEDIANRGTCYTCHPGSATRCLRGAMGSAVAADGTMQMQCQSCHGQMSDVGSPDRVGWFDEPNCQQCHTGTATRNNGQIRFTSAFEPDGTPRVAVNPVFATNPETPVPGVSLYRFSAGHGGLQCSACHGSTHAEYPASHRNDNLQSMALQGHIGVVAECTACHAASPPTVDGGPHGMHPVGPAWVSQHDNYGKSTACQSCHGADYRGTVLSRMFADRTLSVSDDGQSRTHHLWRGQTVSCFICHKREDDGRLGGVFTANHAPVVENTLLATAADTPGPLGLAFTDADGDPGSLRIVRQPRHGTVSLAGSVATYFPDAGYAGPDAFTFAAFDGFTDSNLGVVSVTVGEEDSGRDTDGDGLSDQLEYGLGLSADFPTVYRAPAIESLDGQDYLVMKLPYGIPPPDADIVFEVSGDLQNWTAAAPAEQEGYLLRCKEPLPAGAGMPRFLRARMLRP